MKEDRKIEGEASSPKRKGTKTRNNGTEREAENIAKAERVELKNQHEEER